MSDSYQAIYDAVRSRIYGGNVAEAISDAVRIAFDISYEKPRIVEAFCSAAMRVEEAADRHAVPSAVYRQSIGIDGNKWIAVYGNNLQEGVCGVGDSPAEAMAAFDKAWVTALTAALEAE